MELKEMTFKTNLRYIGWTLLWASLPFLIFIFAIIARYQKAEELDVKNAALSLLSFFIIILLVTIPGFFIHLRYYRRDKGKTLKFRPTYFEITHKSVTKKVYYDEILKIERHHLCWGHKLPWSDYSHIEIILKDDTKLFYSCLIYDGLPSLSWLKNKQLIIEDCEVLYLW